ncbi:MAG: cytochrome b [Proteobacteria bacterium]|jgi:cytochrome b561|nr:cytochrome b [Pseudomonadota bacterium]
MQAAPTRTRFNPLSIGAHWLTLVLLIAVYALIELRDIYPKGSDARELMKTWHYMLGLTVFGIVFVRLALSAIFRAPPIEPAPPKWQLSLAKAMHVALYAFLVAMPLLGWLAVSAKGHPVPFFGLELPALVGPNKALGKNIENIHETIGVLGYYLIGLHAAAALVHHYLMGDNTLRRMLPWRARERSSAQSRGLRSA